VRWSSRDGALAAAVLLVTLGVPGGAQAYDNSACRGLSPGDQRQPWVTCTKLSASLLQSLEHATISEVQQAMNAPGRPSDDDGTGLHYESNWHEGADGYSGVINFTFGVDGRVAIISGIIDPSNKGESSPGLKRNYTWNAAGFFCSDLPGSDHRCDGPDANPLRTSKFENQVTRELQELEQ
jgi:hypothetical protein